MIKGQVWLLVFILFYFGFYCIKFRNNIRLKPLVDIKTEFQSDIDLFYEHISFKNWKKAVVSILLIIIGIIILVFLSILGLFLLILKISLLFLKKIVIYETDNKFEFFKYVILPMSLAYLFIEYSKTVNISNTSVNMIICFGDKIIKLISEYSIIPIALLFIFVVCYVIKLSLKNDTDFIKELFEYFWTWIKIIIVTLLFILIGGSYVLLLDEIKNSSSNLDSYTIIPIFIASCIVTSKIIVRLIVVKSNNASMKAKRHPFRTKRKYRRRRIL
ncbi:hypothetical protein LIZ13_02880 [Streptococcus oralis]|uniref:hypothetical protein n=1 Tax=Streptococcus oralis TaxID=1303 RepID=UPI001D06417B|nr:hypothetical protein [Streptococcus oralis]MCB7106882.1 hypothetical protein [Streptococcus oralis]MCQ5168834.1 hypothetical protein [Streptococcus oralis]MCY7108084.1 hypothetical protein [Streptococcus oralis]